MCTIGGNLGTNAGGLCCVKYGVTRDAVLGLEVVLADGTVLRLGGKNVKDVAGYGLIPLLVGSQGTLGLMTEATLRLLPAPPPRVDADRVLPVARGGGRRGRGADDRRACGRSRWSSWTGSRSAPWTTSTGWGWTATRRRCCWSSRTCRAAPPTPRWPRPCRCARRPARRPSSGPRTPQEADWLRQGRRMAFRALEQIGVARMEDVGRARAAGCRTCCGRSRRSGPKHRLLVGTFGHAGDGNLHPTFVLDRAEGDAAVGAARGRAGGPVRGGARARRHGHRRARDRGGPSRLARPAARRGRGRGHALDQAGDGPAEPAQPGRMVEASIARCASRTRAAAPGFAGSNDPRAVASPSADHPAHVHRERAMGDQRRARRIRQPDAAPPPRIAETIAATLRAAPASPSTAVPPPTSTLSSPMPPSSWAAACSCLSRHVRRQRLPLPSRQTDLRRTLPLALHRWPLSAVTSPTRRRARLRRSSRSRGDRAAAHRRVRPAVWRTPTPPRSSRPRGRPSPRLARRSPGPPPTPPRLASL